MSEKNETRTVNAAETWNVALNWCNGTSTNEQVRGTLTDARVALHTLTTSEQHRQGRRPLLGVLARADEGRDDPNAEVVHYRRDGSMQVTNLQELEFAERRTSVDVVIGAREPSGDTLDWIDDTACLSLAQATRRHRFVRDVMRPHDDDPRYYFVRRLRVPRSESEVER
jgi:hypothetical protein